MNTHEKYCLILKQLSVVNNLLMTTVKDLDSVRNKYNRTEYDTEMLNWLLKIRYSIEEEKNNLETIRQNLWKEMQKGEMK